jgi:uncharacterized protein (TIGR02147 family)
MGAFSYTDYKKCVNDWIDSQDKGGHGQLRKLSKYLGINSVVMSQVFRGDRDLTLEQALGVANFIGFSQPERDYFLLLVQKARAGTVQLKAVYENQIEELRKKSLDLKNRIQHQKLTDVDQATFYSHWYYSAIRLGVSIPRLNQSSSIAEYLDLPRPLVAKVLQFLLDHKLVTEKDGKFDMGPQVTHVGSDSPLVARHHNNWRIQGLRAIERQHDFDLFYSGPMAVSREFSTELKSKLIELIETSTKKAAKSNSETLQCLNIDWFQVGN